MCQFFSAVILHKHRKILFSTKHDNHHLLLEEAKIKGDSASPNFVRVELLPDDNDIFNHSLKNWKLHVDQDLIPDWFDEKEAERLAKIKIKIVFKEMFLVGKELQELRDKSIRFMKDATIRKMLGNSTVSKMLGNSTVSEMWDNSTVSEMLGNSTAKSHKSTNPQIMTNNKKIKIKYV